MGSTVMFRLAAEQRAYVEENISSIVALDPVLVPWNHNSPLLKVVIPVQDHLFHLFHMFGQHEFAYPEPASKFMISLICKEMEFICLAVARIFESSDLSLNDE